MSKKILIDETLLDRIIGDLTLSEKVAPIWQEQYRYMSDILDLKTAIEKSNSGCYSVLEWHGFDETPESGKVILMLWNDGSIDTVYPSDEWPALKSVRAWAYLPE